MARPRTRFSPNNIWRLNIENDDDLLAWCDEALSRHINILEFVKSAWRKAIQSEKDSSEQQARILDALKRIESKVMAAPMTTATPSPDYLTDTEKTVDELFDGAKKMGWE